MYLFICNILNDLLPPSSYVQAPLYTNSSVIKNKPGLILGQDGTKTNIWQLRYRAYGPSGNRPSHIWQNPLPALSENEFFKK